MTPTVFLIVGVAALGAGIVLAVVGITARAADGGVARALAAIDSHYTRHAPTAAETATDPFAALPGWLRGLAVRLSPSGISATLQRRLDLAGNPSAWTPD